MFHHESVMGGIHGGWWLVALLVVVAVLFLRWGRHGQRGNRARRARDAQFALLRRQSDRRDLTPPDERVLTPEPPAMATHGRRASGRVRDDRWSEPLRSRGGTGVPASPRRRGAIRRTRCGESSSPPIRH
jgi:hypothetical protein